jgi:methionine-rich copper-binding protein CopC
MNWGYKLTIAFTCFVILMATLVYKSMRTQFHLVSKNYYTDELAYQQVIDANNNAINDKLIVATTAQNQLITISFNNNSITESIKGKAWLYNATTELFDKKVEFETGNQLPVTISLNKPLPKGNYVLKLWYVLNKKNYYTESKINL